MRSRITKRAEHTTTHAHRIAGLRRAARKLSGAYVAPGVFDAQAPALAARPDSRADLIAGGSATLWVVPGSGGAIADGVGSNSATRPERARTLRVRRAPASVTAAPVDWASVRTHHRA